MGHNGTRGRFSQYKSILVSKPRTGKRLVGPVDSRGRRWPQPSMPGPFRQAYLDVKGEQSLEQLGLAIKMMLAEPAARYLFAAVLK